MSVVYGNNSWGWFCLGLREMIRKVKYCYIESILVSTPSIPNIRRFAFSRYIAFAMHLDIYYV
jgi:hypothetical protein